VGLGVGSGVGLGVGIKSGIGRDEDAVMRGCEVARLRGCTSFLGTRSVVLLLFAEMCRGAWSYLQCT
jgi:hypothetical protein